MGLTAEQERLYQHLLRNPGCDPAAEGFDAEALDELRTLGLVDDAFVPIAPPMAFERLIQRRMREASRELRQITAAWDLVRDLDEEQRSGRQVELVERIEGAINVNRRIQEIHKDEVMSLKRSPRTLHSAFASEQEFRTAFRRKMANGLVCRTMVRPESLEDPELLAYAREQIALGDLHRVTDEPARTMIILDRSIAFVQLDPEDYTRGALQIRQPGTVAVLVDLYELMWSRAREIDEPVPSAIERQVLQALAAYDKDELAARAVNVSVRKFRAHVAEVMARLGAANRFQAALLAKERGWI